MRRRDFLAASCVTGLAAGTAAAAAGNRRPGQRRDYYELRKYEIESEDQKTRLDAFLRDAAVPALNRIEISPVGVFYPAEGLGAIYVLLRHRSSRSLASTTRRLLADEEFVRKGADVLDTPAAKPAYKRMESSIMAAFDGMRELEIPSKKDSRVFQLRTYESHSIKAGQKKIEMFNVGEIAIFREVGLNPVFFGETLAGAKMPNLTYMLGFDDAEQQKAGWRKFGGNPEWQKLRAMEEYADKNIISNITNIPLKPAEYSQI
ncbi:MAG: NIPSNAP family protein [Sedimentisphaerales bacterium]|nr:NIPSNAP family protein [Sedimentisphaerales bacterium]